MGGKDRRRGIMLFVISHFSFHFSYVIPQFQSGYRVHTPDTRSCSSHPRMKYLIDDMRTPITDNPVKHHEAALERGRGEGFREQAQLGST